MINIEIIEIVMPAFVTGLLCTALHVPLGVEVLKRGIVFIDLATAQVAGVAIVALNVWVMEPSWAGIQVAAFGAAAAFAFLFRWVEMTLPDEQEAIIGSCFIVAASVTLLLLANNPHGGEKLEHVLSGQILFTSWSDLAAFLPVYLLVAGLWVGYPNLRSGQGFFLLFALAITASVQLLGVYVVFASLILPALAGRRADGSYNLWRALLSGGLAVVVGIVVSTAADLPAGPFLVLCFAVSAIVVRVIAHWMSRPASRSGLRQT
jgi:zinc/manganese transport system permease protein